jgi:hypothetical protein
MGFIMASKTRPSPLKNIQHFYFTTTINLATVIPEEAQRISGILALEGTRQNVLRFD